MKTNAARLLDELKTSYELRNYTFDPDDLSAESVAEKIGLPAAQVFKTLLVKGDAAICFAVVPADTDLDLKAMAKVSGNRKADMARLNDLQPLTGYIRGGVTVLAAKRDYPVYVDETLILCDVISVSAGVRGTQILLSPQDYLQVTKGVVTAIAKPKR